MVVAGAADHLTAVIVKSDNRIVLRAQTQHARSNYHVHCHCSAFISYQIVILSEAKDLRRCVGLNCPRVVLSDIGKN